MPLNRFPSSASPSSRSTDPRQSGVRRAPFGLFGVRSTEDASPDEDRGDLGPRESWTDICRRDDLRGRWVALDDCEYADAGDRPRVAVVVDADEDLAALCARMRASKWRSCAIHFCDCDAG